MPIEYMILSYGDHKSFCLLDLRQLIILIIIPPVGGKLNAASNLGHLRGKKCLLSENSIKTNKISHFTRKVSSNCLPNPKLPLIQDNG